MPRSSIACDVLVVGAGVAGISAAVRAAREGAHTVLIEKGDHPGGVAVAGMHRFICGLYDNGDGMPDATLNGGIASEICTRLERLEPEKKVQRMGKVHVLPFRTRDLVSTFRSLSEEKRELEILYNTQAVSVRKDGDSIASIAAQGPTGAVGIFPRAVIDCSGNGTIMQMSDARHRLTPPDQQQLAGYTFRVEGLRDLDELLPVRVPFCLTKAVNAGVMPSYLRFTTFTPGDDPGEGYCRLNVPPAGENRDERARNDALRVHEHLSRVLSEFQGSEITEMYPGVVFREGPRVCGEYTLSAEDVLKARKFHDGAVKNAWPIELWDQGSGPSYQYLDPGDHYEIPLRCLKVDDLSNCWCAGRCISVTHEALGSTRVMGTCISLGEQAGCEAARSV